MPKIYVTRHGQSMTNIDADIALRDQGRAVSLNTVNNVLTRTGIQEAIDYAERLQADGVEIGEIICSPYGRTKQTAFTIASVLATLPPITYRKDFQEIAWDVGGKFDRLENYIEGFDSKNLAIGERPMIDHRRGAFALESQQDVYDRVIPAFFNAAKRAKKHNVLVVSHFFVTRAIMSFMDCGTSDKMLDFSPKNLCRLSWDYDEVMERFDQTFWTTC